MAAGPPATINEIRQQHKKQERKFSVIAEDDDNWFWFLQQLCQIVQDHANQFLGLNALTLLSDRQKGLIDGVARVFPNSPHGYCLRHLEANFHKQFKHPELKSILWRAA